MSAAENARAWLDEIAREASGNSADPSGLMSTLRGGTSHVRALLDELDRVNAGAAELKEMHAEHVDALRQERDNLRDGMVVPLRNRLNVLESIEQGWEAAHADRVAERDAALAIIQRVREYVQIRSSRDSREVSIILDGGGS